MLARNDPEHILDTALNALATGPECHAMLDELPLPIYTTDADGAVTYWNRACVAFAGREPALGRDRWCITWQLFTTAGNPLRREDSPMAQAVRFKRPIRDSIVIAKRPDGTRVAFKPYPTPILHDDGRVMGAVNMLIDVTDEQTDALHRQAEHCRRLADATYDRVTNKVLGDMAMGFEKTANDLSSKRSN